MLRQFIGGQALATYTLLKELPLDAKPFGPESKLVMMTGPVTGTGLTPGGTKVTAVFLSPLTERTLGRGAASGFWAPYLKAAGYDGIHHRRRRAKTHLPLYRRRKSRASRRPQRLGGGHARDRELCCGRRSVSRRQR